MAWKGLLYCSLLCAVLVLVQPREYQYFDYDSADYGNESDNDINISLVSARTHFVYIVFNTPTISALAPVLNYIKVTSRG